MPVFRDIRLPHIRRKLGHKHEVVVVSPSEYYQWIPSNIWVGVGRMTIDQVRFKLKPLYEKWGIQFEQAKATAIHPEGGETSDKPYVSVEYTFAAKKEKQPILIMTTL